MCDVFTALEVGLAIAGTYSQGQQAKAQVRALDNQRKAQAEELAAKRDMSIGQRVAAARREAAARLVSAGEAGVAGQSMMLDIADAFGRANQDNAVTAKQAEFEDRASAVSYASGVASVDRPSVMDSALQIARGYAKGRELSRKLAIGKRQYIDSPASTSSSRYA